MIHFPVYLLFEGRKVDVLAPCGVPIIAAGIENGDGEVGERGDEGSGPVGGWGRFDGAVEDYGGLGYLEAFGWELDGGLGVWFRRHFVGRGAKVERVGRQLIRRAVSDCLAECRICPTVR